MRIKIHCIQLITIDFIDWREKKQYPEKRNNKEKESNNNIFSKCVKGDNK